jgi:hypothetical protein
MPPKTKTKTRSWSTKEVRELIQEILTFQNDSLQSALMTATTEEFSEDSRLTRSQVEGIGQLIEHSSKDAAFRVLASKKL